eukprot:TRINITY_DN30255_c0_g3_i1.p1 TRINITY_DN30255_c0_g3~~TRINITY_DN30255_c0_g3_i1.p1  ORF type:complete len:176 (+),score=25.97 TRINITY_DN30255_c0_g3_i1:51-578(+)
MVCWPRLHALCTNCGCLRVQVRSLLGRPCSQDEATKQECASSSNRDASCQMLEIEDAASPASGGKYCADEPLSVGVSGSEFNSCMADKVPESHGSNGELFQPAAEAYELHMSHLDEFLTDVSKAPQSLVRHLLKRRQEDEEGLFRHGVQDVPRVQVQWAPPPIEEVHSFGSSLSQ